MLACELLCLLTCPLFILRILELASMFYLLSITFIGRALKLRAFSRTQILNWNFSKEVGYVSGLLNLGYTLQSQQWQPWLQYSRAGRLLLQSRNVATTYIRNFVAFPLEASSSSQYQYQKKYEWAKIPILYDFFMMQRPYSEFQGWIKSGVSS